MKHLNDGAVTDEFMSCYWSSQDDEASYSVAVPLGCYSPVEGKWLEFSAKAPPRECLGAGTSLKTLSGESFELGDAVAPHVCEASGSSSAAVAARWPDGQAFAYTAGDNVSAHVPPEVSQNTDKQLPQMRETLLEVANRVKRTTLPPMKVEQMVRVEVDGDDQPDLLVAVSAPDPEDVTSRFGGLFLIKGASPDDVHPVAVSVMWSYEVLMVSDLDQNGRDEVVVKSSYYEGFIYSMEQLVGEEWSLLGFTGCGA